jgi:hypothetical protein
MSGRNLLHLTWMLFLAAFLGVGLGFPASAQNVNDVRVEWGPDYRWLRFSYLEQDWQYARDLLNTQFPPAGQPPEVKVYKNWPVVSLQARWTASAKGWPEKYRKDAVDIMLMFACDAQMYEYLFPDVIKSSRFTFPPEFLTEAQNPQFNLAQSLRGKEVGYQITAKAGFGASDYTIKTKIRIGLDDSEKTVFFHDKPEYISEHLKTRQYFFAGSDAGDCIKLEAKIYCECAPRYMLQGEAMRRVENTSRYFVQRIYERLDNAPTLQEIEDYLAMVKGGYQNFADFAKKYHLEDQ